MTFNNLDIQKLTLNLKARRDPAKDSVSDTVCFKKGPRHIRIGVWVSPNEQGTKMQYDDEIDVYAKSRHNIEIISTYGTISNPVTKSHSYRISSYRALVKVIDRSLVTVADESVKEAQQI